MRYAFAPVALGLSANALVVRQASQCVRLQASGGASGVLGQLDDGQNRIGGDNPTGCYCLNGDGAFTDANGRGCILTPPTTQFQCDAGANPTTGFGIGPEGGVTYSGNGKFYACPVNDQGEFNVYAQPAPGQEKCVEISLGTAGSCGAGNVPAPGVPAPKPEVPAPNPEVPTPEIPGVPTPEVPGVPTPEIPGVPTPEVPGVPTPEVPGVPTPEVPGVPTPQVPGVPKPEIPGVPTPEVPGVPTPEVPGVPTPEIPGVPTPELPGVPAPEVPGVPAPEVPFPQVPAPEVPAACPPVAPAPEVPAPEVPAPGIPAPEVPAPGENPNEPGQNGPGQNHGRPNGPSGPGINHGRPNGPGHNGPGQNNGRPGQNGPGQNNGRPGQDGPGQNNGRPGQDGPGQNNGRPGQNGPGQNNGRPNEENPAGPNAGDCPADLNGNYQYPHLIVSIDSENPDNSHGTSYNGKIDGHTCSLYNFDIPASMAGKRCTLNFLLPEQKDLETSSFTTSGHGKVNISKLRSPATEQTTYANKPAKDHEVGSMEMAPGHSYNIYSGDCAAGETMSYEMCTEGDFSMEYFQDWNPSPIGMYIRQC